MLFNTGALGAGRLIFDSVCELVADGLAEEAFVLKFLTKINQNQPNTSKYGFVQMSVTVI